MMEIFQYMFYRIENVYRKWDESAPNIPSTIIVSGCQTFNVLTILPVILRLNINNWLLIITFILFNICNELCVLSRKRRETFSDRWQNEKLSKKRIKGILIIAYIIGSVALYACSFDWYTGYSGWKWEF